MQAVAYSRHSWRAHKSESSAQQLDAAREYCNRMGWEVIGEFADEEKSGGTVKHRPELERALELACNHKAVLVVRSLSRLARSARDALDIEGRLRKAGAKLCMIKESVDTSTPTGRMFFTMLAAFAEFERDLVIQRTSDAMRRHQAAGRSMGGKPPYGFQREWRQVDTPRGKPVRKAFLVPNEREQSIIRIIKDLRIGGYSYQQIADALEEGGHANRRGNTHWSVSNIYRIANNAYESEICVERGV